MVGFDVNESFERVPVLLSLRLGYGAFQIESGNMNAGGIPLCGRLQHNPRSTECFQSKIKRWYDNLLSLMILRRSYPTTPDYVKQNLGSDALGVNHVLHPLNFFE
jgi:hypothetical protein